jgi:uncharacterized protein (TIRG00374 family)
MIVLVLRELDLAALRESIATASLWPIIPFLLLFLLHFIFRALRWRLLLPAPKTDHAPLRTLFDAMMLGNMASFILPFRLGEFLRPFVLSRWSDYTFAAAFVSVVLERFFDLSAVLIAFAVVAALFEGLPNAIHTAAWSLGGLAGCILIFLMIGAIFPEPLRKIVDLSTRILPLPSRGQGVVCRFLNELIDGAAVIGSPARLLGIVLLSAGVWFTACGQFYVMLRIFPLEHSFLFATAITVFVSLAVALPSAPGFIGVFQAGCLAAGELFGYPRENIFVLSMLVHLLSYVLYLSIGGWILAVRDVNLFDLKHAAEEGEDAAS